MSDQIIIISIVCFTAIVIVCLIYTGAQLPNLLKYRQNKRREQDYLSQFNQLIDDPTKPHNEGLGNYSHFISGTEKELK